MQREIYVIVKTYQQVPFDFERESLLLLPSIFAILIEAATFIQ